MKQGVLCVLTGLAFCLIFPRISDAQEHRDSYNIIVKTVSDECVYRVETEPGVLAEDQNTIRVKPNGRVEFEMVDTQGRVEVADEASSGTKGTDGAKKAKVKKNLKAELRARNAKGSKSTHNITITCCDSFGFLGLGCTNPRIANPESTGGMGALIPMDALHESTLRGPAASDETLLSPVFRRIIRDGGPVMEVDP